MNKKTFCGTSWGYDFLQQVYHPLLCFCPLYCLLKSHHPLTESGQCVRCGMLSILRNTKHVIKYKTKTYKTYMTRCNFSTNLTDDHRRKHYRQWQVTPGTRYEQGWSLFQPPLLMGPVTAYFRVVSLLASCNVAVAVNSMVYLTLIVF